MSALPLLHRTSIITPHKMEWLLHDAFGKLQRSISDFPTEKGHDEMDLKRYYDAIKQRIDGINFAMLWKGFKPYKFALYNDTQCYFDGTYVDRTDAFLANTSILYNGEHIAIWGLSEQPKDLDRLAASIIHEMFHAFQSESGECRWPDEIGALFVYKYAPLNLALKMEEAAQIKQILIERDPSCFGRLLEIRKYRCSLFPYEYQYEGKTEQIEGSANYVEMKALSQISSEKYTGAIAGMIDSIMDPRSYFPIRIISYNTGALLLECISKCSHFNPCTFTDKTFAEEILENVAGAQVDVPICHASALIQEYNHDTRDKINRALKKNKVIAQGCFDLVGLNIWDARCDGNYVTSSYLVAYLDSNETKIVNGDFVVAFDADKKVRTIYEQ